MLTVGYARASHQCGMEIPSQLLLSVYRRSSLPARHVAPQLPPGRFDSVAKDFLTPAVAASVWWPWIGNYPVDGAPHRALTGVAPTIRSLPAVGFQPDERGSIRFKRAAGRLRMVEVR